jgi:hypothetical protein
VWPRWREHNLPGAVRPLRDRRAHMSTTNELNGTNGTATGETAGPKNRLRAALPTGTRFQRLYALAAKAEKRSFTLRRTFDGEGTIALRIDGPLPPLTPEGVAKLAADYGAKEKGSTPIGAAEGGWTAVLVGKNAADTVGEMVAE